MAQKNNEDKLLTITSRSIELFLRNGYEETTMRMIQDATGLHSGSIYYVINGKEGILLMISEGFIGDIMCRSSRIARELGDPRLNVLLPPAFLLHATSSSKCMSRLLGQMFRTDSVMMLISTMAKEWSSRVDMPDDIDIDSALSFIYGGLGSMIRTDKGLREGMGVMTSFLSLLIGKVGTDMLDTIEEVVRREELPFYDMYITEIDSIFGDELNG